MKSLRTSPLAAALVLASCAASPRATDTLGAQSLGASVGELPGALPSNANPTDRARTDAMARVVLDARRERALELYQRYLHALVDNKLDALGPLFDDVLTVIDGGNPVARPRGAVLREVARFHTQNGVADIAPLVHTLRPVVRSYNEARRMSGSSMFGMRSGDWMVEAPADSMLGLQTMGWVFRRVVVRWVNDVPIIVGVYWETSRLR